MAHDCPPYDTTRRDCSAPNVAVRTPRSNRLRDVAGKDQPHDFVAEVCNRVEHERTATVDHGDAVLAPVGRRSGADAALTIGPMHPHLLDPELSALSHGALRLVGRGG